MRFDDDCSSCYQMEHLTGSTADTFLEYIQRNLPEGVAMKVTKVGVCWLWQPMAAVFNSVHAFISLIVC